MDVGTDFKIESLQGVLVLSAIPVVLIALWAEYFGKYIESMEPRELDDEREECQRQSRLVAFCGVIAQVSANLIAFSQFKVPAWIAYLVFLFSVGLQALVQRSLDQKLKGREQTTKQAGFGLSAVFWVLVDIAVYWVVVLSFVGAARFLGPMIGQGPFVKEGAMFLGGLVGMFAGIGVNYALAPLFFRQMFPCKELKDAHALQLFGQCFRRAGISEPSYYLMELDHFGVNNAMIAGFKFGKGPFRPALFITRGLLKDLSYAELEAVVLHEVSHLHLNHITKRFTYGFGALLFATALALVVVGALGLLLPMPIAVGIGIFVMLSPFAAPYLLIKSLSKKQEFEADSHAVLRLGARGEALISVLEKLEMQHEALLGKLKIQKQVHSKKADTHPTTEDRIDAIKKILAQMPKEAVPQSVDSKQAA